ncbi:MAG: EAL domain-containing protein [Bacillota bacterium]|nr:EAL domain-containing protein [Bacillota bacterium]
MKDVFKRLSVKNKLIVSIFLGCLIPFLIGGIYIKKVTENHLYYTSIESTNQLLEQVSKRVDDSIIITMKEQVNMMTKDVRMINIDENITNYTNYSSDNFKANSSECEQNIMDYFGTLKETHEFVNFVFLGTSTGAYIEYPKFLPKDDYDPRVRPWYKNTIESDEILISEPYITKVTNEMVISLTKAFKGVNNIDAVIGISVKLNDLMESINNLKIGESGYIIALDSNDKILVSPKNNNWILKTPKELKLEELNYFNVENGESFEGKIDGVEKVFNVYISPYSNWKYISVVDKNEIFNQSKDLVNILFYLYLLILIIVILIIIIIANYITEPILTISNEMNKIANFNFDSYESEKIEKYISHEDEIGVISKSLNSMYLSFSELNDNLYQMNKEIQLIDIEKKADYKLTLSKGNLFSYIAVSINNLIEKIQDYLHQITENNELLKITEEELIAQLGEISSQKEYIKFLADHDSLTELPNRRKFREKLEYVLLKKYRGIVILLDLDNFKSINDTLGHIFGDGVLKEFSKRLKSISRDDIFVSRFGGDEFLILASCKDEERTRDFIFYLHQVLDKKIIIDNVEIEIKFSMGVTFFPDDSTNINQLIMNADLALYSVKERNKNDYAIFSEDMGSQIKESTIIEHILSEAIENDGFKMVYQPQINLVTGEIIAYEALLRLKNHNISPGKFIEVAEKTGLIIKIGRIVTRMVVKQISIWKKRGYPIKPVAINFSAIQINDKSYFEFLSETLKVYNVEASFIEIEITENVFLGNKELTLEFINKLKSINIKISIDDFGTGYSSLSYLTFLPVDKVKFDRSLNLELLKNKSTEVIQSLISVMHSLDLEVIAEGIEEYEHVKKLKTENCDVIQGYYFSKPLEVEDVEKTFYTNYLDSI